MNACSQIVRSSVSLLLRRFHTSVLKKLQVKSKFLENLNRISLYLHNQCTHTASQSSRFYKNYTTSIRIKKHNLFFFTVYVLHPRITFIFPNIMAEPIPLSILCTKFIKKIFNCKTFLYSCEVNVSEALYILYITFLYKTSAFYFIIKLIQL